MVLNHQKLGSDKDQKMWCTHETTAETNNTIRDVTSSKIGYLPTNFQLLDWRSSGGTGPKKALLFADVNWMWVKMENLGDHRCWSSLVLTIQLLRYVILTHTQLSTPPKFKSGTEKNTILGCLPSFFQWWITTIFYTVSDYIFISYCYIIV